MPDDVALSEPLVEDGHGTGLIPSPPDSRDFPITNILSAELLGAAPASYVVPGLSTLPVLNQGITPQCVAYAHSALKAYEDRKDQGAYFNFNEWYFFALIGGTINGAFIRSALDRLLHYGYPVVNVGDAGSHKITAYFRINEDIESIKQAVMAYGPVIMGTRWFGSWEHLNSNYQVPAPSGSEGGHCVIIVGWDWRGFRCRNSWGIGWGTGGDFFMPYSYALTYGFEFWKAMDQVIAPALTFPCIIKKGTYTGYKFSSTGALLTEKTGSITSDSSIGAFSRIAIPNQSGVFYTIASGTWAGYVLREEPGLYKKGTTPPPVSATNQTFNPARQVILGKGTHTGYQFYMSTGNVKAVKSYTWGSGSSGSATSATVVMNQYGRWLAISGGAMGGYLLKESNICYLKA